MKGFGPELSSKNKRLLVAAPIRLHCAWSESFQVVQCFLIHIFSGGGGGSCSFRFLTLLLFSQCLRARGKRQTLSNQTPMLQKAFSSTNWTHMQQSCQAKLLSHVKDQWGGRKTQTPLLSVYANRGAKKGGKRGQWAVQIENCAVMQTKKAHTQKTII